ncbi:MAG: sigma-70 family RNA polymerase sigma factor [Pseudomonadota bacterium]
MSGGEEEPDGRETPASGGGPERVSGASRAAADSASRSAAESAAPAATLEDEALIVRIALRRDRIAFSELFRRFGLKVKAFMIRSGAAPDEADEAAQETLLAVWRRAETFDPDRASAAAWLFAIARNKRVDLLRRGARPEPDPEDPLFKQEPTPPADHALSAERRDAAVRDALAALSADQREVVLLSFYQGCAHSEIAERLGIPLGTVKSRLRLAFGKLRNALGDAFRDELDED